MAVLKKCLTTDETNSSNQGHPVKKMILPLIVLSFLVSGSAFSKETQFQKDLRVLTKRVLDSYNDHNDKQSNDNMIIARYFQKAAHTLAVDLYGNTLTSDFREDFRNSGDTAVETVKKNTEFSYQLKSLSRLLAEKLEECR